MASIQCQRMMFLRSRMSSPRASNYIRKISNFSIQCSETRNLQNQLNFHAMNSSIAHKMCFSLRKNSSQRFRDNSGLRKFFHNSKSLSPQVSVNHSKNKCLHIITSVSPSSSSSSSSSSSLPVESPFPEELPKAFDFTMEEKIYSWWENEGHFKPKENPDLDSFVISMPPPNVTGALHMGHAMFVTLEDIMVRFSRMRGRETLWLPGTDHAGIATQLVVEKMLCAEGTKRSELGREEFLKRVWEWKQQYGDRIGMQIRRLGASCDWSRERFTLDSDLSNSVIEAFLQLYEKGLIYQGNYMVNWSPFLQTAVSDLEVEYSEEMGMLYYLKYPISGSEKDDYIPIATTRPETLLGDTALAIHPNDERYAKFKNKKAFVPFVGREIPIISDEYVDMEFGTGALKITPGHDQNDYVLGKKFNLKIINIMNKDGTLNDNAGNYSGMDRFDARKVIWEDLKKENLALKTENHKTRVPRSQRGGEIIEPLVSKQWFVSMEKISKPALMAVKNSEIQIIPHRFEKIYNHWLENINDWCISRQLWWGHRIPVWYVKPTNANEINNEKKNEKNEKVGGHGGGENQNAKKLTVLEKRDAEEGFVVARNEKEAYEKAISIYGKNVILEQDPDVLDTWFSSGIWPFSTLGWPDTSAKDFQKYYPTTVMETGHDILFFWVARMIILGIELTGKIPFSTIYLHGLVRDSQGRKMSKSLGNVIDPIDTIANFGTDALRFSLATGTTPGQDVNLSMEKLEANKNFTNKIWNAGKFILQNLPKKGEAEQWSKIVNKKFDDEDVVKSLPLPERWVITRLHDVIDKTTSLCQNYEFNETGRLIYDFFWFDFADWYIESSKTKLYGNENAEMKRVAQSVLVYCYQNILKILHPFMPFVTETLYQSITDSNEALIISSWPSTNLPKDFNSIKQFNEIKELIRCIRNARAEYNVEPKKKISAFIILRNKNANYIVNEMAVLVALAKLDENEMFFTAAAPNDTSQCVHLVVSDEVEVYLPLKGLVDVSKEIERLKKQITRVQGEMEGLNKRLSSPSFVEKAPAQVVQGVRDQTKEGEEKLALLKNSLAQLEEMVATAT